MAEIRDSELMEQELEREIAALNLELSNVQDGLGIPESFNLIANQLTQVLNLLGKIQVISGVRHMELINRIDKFEKANLDFGKAVLNKQDGMNKILLNLGTEVSQLHTEFASKKDLDILTEKMIKRFNDMDSKINTQFEIINQNMSLLLLRND